jgi:hypothetical protein
VTPRFERAIRDHPWLTATLFFFAAAVYRAIAVLLVPKPLDQDEAMWLEAAHWFWHEGLARVHAGNLPILYPALLSPLSGLLDFASAHALAKVFNSLISAAALFPIWRVGRRLMPDIAALFFAIISVIGVPGTFASVVMAESLFFFLFWMLLASFASAIDRPTRSNAAKLALASLFLLSAKPQSAPAVAVVSIAFWVTPRFLPIENMTATRWRRAKRTFALVVLIGVVILFVLNRGMLFGSYYGSESRHFHPSLVPAAQELLGLLALLALETGVLPVAMILAEPRRLISSPKPEYLRVLKIALSCLVLTYLLIASVFGSMVTRDRLHERHIFFVSPILLILAGAAASRRGMHRRGAIILASLAAAVVIGLGLRQFPAYYVLDIISAPSRAALLKTPNLQAGPPVAAVRALSQWAAVLAAVTVAVGLSLRSFRGRFVLIATLATTLGCLVSLSQIKWSGTWARQRYARLTAEDSVIPPEATVHSMHDGPAIDIALFERASRPNRVNFPLFRDLAIVGTAGALAGYPVPESNPSYWVVPEATSLWAERLYHANGLRIYRSSGPPRLKTRWTGVSQGNADICVTLQYFPENPFQDESTLRFSLRPLPGNGPVNLAASSATEKADWLLPAEGTEQTIRLSRAGTGAMTVALDTRGCGPAASAVPPCYTIERITVVGPQGDVADELYP